MFMKSSLAPPVTTSQAGAADQEVGPLKPVDLSVAATARDLGRSEVGRPEDVVSLASEQQVITSVGVDHAAATLSSVYVVVAHVPRRMSLPAPPSMESSPEPPLTRSSPPRVQIESSPPCPRTVSSPTLPTITSSPGVPWMSPEPTIVADMPLHMLVPVTFFARSPYAPMLPYRV